MSKFTNKITGVVVSVADHKDDRWTSSEEWEQQDDEPAPAPSKKRASSSDGE